MPLRWMAWESLLLVSTQPLPLQSHNLVERWAVVTVHSNTTNDHKIWFMIISWFSSSSIYSSKCSPGRVHKQKRRLVVRSHSLGNPHVRQGATTRGRRRGKGEKFDRNLKAQGAEVQNQDIGALKSSHWNALWSKT